MTIKKPVICECQNCDWTGPAGDLDAISETGIFDRVAPGEIMPHGCCPKCGAFAHARGAEPLNLENLIRQALAYEADQFDGDPNLPLDVSGADLVDWFTDWRERARSYLNLIAPTSPVGMTTHAVAHLKKARDLLKAAEAPQALDRVRHAIKSAEGAVRHAQGKADRPQVEV